MSVDQAPARDGEHDAAVRADVWRRIAVTVLALVAVRLAAYVPVPGLNPRAVADLYAAGGDTAAIARVSILSLDILPIISAMVLAELARITISDVRIFAQRQPARFRSIVLLAGLALAAFQSIGLAFALERIPDLVAEPGWAARFGIFVSVLAGTALAVWLASLIDRHGVGCGVWLIYLAPILGALYYAVPTHFTAVQSGLITPELSVAVILGLLAATVAIVGLMTARPGVAAMQLIWPSIIAYTAIGWLSAPLVALDQTPLALSLLEPSSPLHIAAYAALIVAVYVLRANAEQADHRAGVTRPAPSEGVQNQAGAPALLVLLLILIANDAAHSLTQNDAEIVGGMTLTIIVAVSVTVLRALGLIR